MIMNLEISTSDMSHHGGKSADIPSEEIPDRLSQVLTPSTQDIERPQRPTVRSMKAFFEAMVRAESAKKFAANITLEEEPRLPISDKGSRVRYSFHIIPPS